ncbi:MAG TPA: hypothetical protein VIF57_15100 [Polyangia bacterium]
MALALGAAASASCGVDKSGLGSMPFLPHDAGDGMGTAGASGNPGAGGSSPMGVAGAPGTGGSAGSSIAGAGGSAGTGGNAGTAGDAGTAGAGGTAGSTGAGGNDTSGAAGDGATAGTTGAAGNPGTAGDTGMAGNDGTAGTTGAAGDAGTGGTAGSAGAMGTAGKGGSAGTGGSAGVGGNGGRGGTGGIGIPCNATTCGNGCCADATTCVRMRTVTQCGGNGSACVPCGGCQTCSPIGQCRVDPASRWTIIAVSAQLSVSNWDRNFGDVGGPLPDPFCEFENPAGQVTTSTAGVTDTITDTLKPTWNQVISPAGMTVAASTLMANNPTWQIWVGDDDGCATPSCLADVACTIKQPITESQLRAGQLIVTKQQSCESVTINFMCQP